MTSARIQSRDGQLVLPEAAVFQAYAVDTISLTTSLVEQAIFTSVSINRGNHFNSGTGRFTAPCPGIYKFGTAMIAGNDNDVYRFRFYKNGAYTGNSLRVDNNATGSEYGTNGQMEIYLELEAGDYVSVFAKSDAGGDAYGDSTHKYTYFNGRFIA